MHQSDLSTQDIHQSIQLPGQFEIRKRKEFDDSAKRPFNNLSYLLHDTIFVALAIVERTVGDGPGSHNAMPRA
jgi:hypothetical protein